MFTATPKSYTDEQTAEHIAQLTRYHTRLAAEEKRRQRQALRRLVRRSRRANRGQR
jgi:hypothetical protein